MNGKSALIVGASGLVGSELLQLLLQQKEYHTVIAVVRKPLPIKHPKLKMIVCNFNDLHEVQEHLMVDDVFCCLGTTIKKAKTKKAMYTIDVEYPLALARLTQEKQAQHFLLISSMNANANSSIWYPRMKGMLEEQLQTIPFPQISIFRPSLLLGDRKEFRLGEDVASKVFQVVDTLFKGSWKSRLAIQAKTVAKAMYEAAQLQHHGVKIYDAKKMEMLANRPQKINR